MKNILSLLLFFLFTLTGFSQQDHYSWRVGVTGGAMTYYGDLSTQIINIQSPWLDITNNLDHVSYGINVENNFSSAWGWRLSASQGRFQATDRVIDWAGEVQLTPTTYRSINVQTDISNVFFSFSYHTDNGVLLSEQALIAPYINFGIGLTRFTPYADLLSADDNRYYYWSDLTIRNAPEMSVPPTGADIIEQDGVFETNLRDIQTEGVEYNNTVLSFPIGIGLKFRVNDRININLEGQAVYTLTDYLDDVSGEYLTSTTDDFQAYASNPNNASDVFRGEPEGLKDIYGYLSLGVYYNFGYKTEAFLPPVFFTKDASLDKSTLSDTTVAQVEQSIETPTIEGDGGLKIVEDEDIVIINTPDTIQKLAKKKVIVETEEEIIQNSAGQTIKVEKQIVQNPTEVEKVLKIDSIQKVDSSAVQQEINIIQEPKEVISNDIEVINLDGSPAKDTVRQIIELPTMDAPSLTLDTIDTKSMEGMVIKIDDAEEVIESEIDAPMIPKIDTFFTKENNQNSVELLAEVENSRLELAQLQQKYNTAITKSEQNEIEIEALRNELDSMLGLFNSYKQYKNNVAIRGNEDFSKPENQAIAAATEEMAKEIAYLKTQLDLSNSNYKKAYENAQANQQESQAKIKALEKKVAKLKEEVKKAKRPNRKPLRIINSSRTKTEDGVTDIDNNVVRDSIEVSSSVVTRDTVVQIIREEVPVVIEKPILTPIEQNTGNEKVIEARVDSIARALELKQAATLAEKQAEVKLLNERLAALEKQLQFTAKAESSTSKALQEQLALLTKELSALKNQPATVTVSEPEPISLNEIIKGYEKTNVYFNVGKSTVGIEYENKLQKIASLLLLHPELNAVITGYTDKSGNPDVNFRLSQKRANNVKNYFMQQGVQPSRLQTDFQGSSNATKANDPFARRVEVVLVIVK